MKIPVINGMPLKTPENVVEALARHAGGEEEINGVGMFDDFIPAIVGFSYDNRIVYDYDKILEVLMERDGISYNGAVEFVEINTLRVLPYMEKPPIILYQPIDGYEEEGDKESEGN